MHYWWTSIYDFYIAWVVICFALICINKIAVALGFKKDNENAHINLFVGDILILTLLCVSLVITIPYSLYKGFGGSGVWNIVSRFLLDIAVTLIHYLTLMKYMIDMDEVKKENEDETEDVQ